VGSPQRKRGDYIDAGLVSVRASQLTDSWMTTVKLATCSSVACTGTSTMSLMVGTGDVGWFAQIAIGAERLPVIARHDIAHCGLEVVKYSSPTCMPFVRSR
jgi:hypothetical protein